MDTINLNDIKRALLKNLGKILLTMLIFCLVIAAVTIYLIKPQYTTRTTLLVGRPASYQTSGQSLEYNDILLNQKLVGTYGEIIKSDTVLSRVVNNLKLDLSKESLSNMITVRTVNDTEIISLTVVDTIPERAMDIANENAEIFMEEVFDIMLVDNVQILDPATLPTSPSSPNLFINVALAGMIGLISALIYFIYKAMADSRIKSIDELKSNFDIPVIGIIPYK